MTAREVRGSLKGYTFLIIAHSRKIILAIVWKVNLKYMKQA